MNFNFYSKYYDLIYSNKDYNKETTTVLQKINIPSPNILELGCGSGRHAQELSKMNCKITGIDLSETMVKIANEKNIQNFRALHGNIQSFYFNQKFDAAISMFHVISYLNKNEEVINCFDCVSKHLQSGAPFIFDFWFAPAVFHQGFEKRTKKYSDNGIQVIRESDAILNINSNTAEVSFKISVSSFNNNVTEEISEEHIMRFFSIPEIVHFAELTGFKAVDFFDLNTNMCPSLDTWAITAKLIKK